MIIIKSKLKIFALVGLILSAVSLFTHFLLARYTGESFDGYQTSITIFSWRPIFENIDLTRNVIPENKILSPRSHLFVESLSDFHS